MQTEWIWEAKANQAILTKKRSQKVWLKQDLLIRPHHRKAQNASDPLHSARAAEVTSLWRLAV